MPANVRRIASVTNRGKKKKAPISAENPIEATRQGSSISRDTWPAPPPQSAAVPIAHDTIPTPPPDAHDDADEPIIPTLRGVDIDKHKA